MDHMVQEVGVRLMEGMDHVSCFSLYYFSDNSVHFFHSMYGLCV